MKQHDYMDNETLKTLIERYFDGKTTEEEERRIKDFFDSADADESLAGYAPYFSAMSGDDVYDESDAADIERRMGQKIDSWDKVEKHTNRNARHLSIKWITGIAAMMAVVFTIAYATIRENRTLTVATPQDTFDNPEDAYREAERALVTFSEAINNGLDKISVKKEKE